MNNRYQSLRKYLLSFILLSLAHSQAFAAIHVDPITAKTIKVQEFLKSRAGMAVLNAYPALKAVQHFNLDYFPASYALLPLVEQLPDNFETLADKAMSDDATDADRSAVDRIFSTAYTDLHQSIVVEFQLHAEEIKGRALNVEIRNLKAYKNALISADNELSFYEIYGPVIEPYIRTIQEAYLVAFRTGMYREVIDQIFANGTFSVVEFPNSNIQDTDGEAMEPIDTAITGMRQTKITTQDLQTWTKELKNSKIKPRRAKELHDKIVESIPVAPNAGRYELLYAIMDSPKQTTLEQIRAARTLVMTGDDTIRAISLALFKRELAFSKKFKLEIQDALDEITKAINVSYQIQDYNLPPKLERRQPLGLLTTTITSLASLTLPSLIYLSNEGKVAWTDIVLALFIPWMVYAIGAFWLLSTKEGNR